MDDPSDNGLENPLVVCSKGHGGVANPLHALEQRVRASLDGDGRAVLRSSVDGVARGLGAGSGLMRDEQGVLEDVLETLRLTDLAVAVLLCNRLGAVEQPLGVDLELGRVTRVQQQSALA